MALSTDDDRTLKDCTIRVLLVDDDEKDFVLARDTFAGIPGVWFDVQWASTYETGLGLIAQKAHDLFLIDYQLGEHTALDLLRTCHSIGCEPVIIMLTGEENREIDLQAIRSGASDYIMKPTLCPTSLDRTIRYALERKRLRLERDQLTAQLVQTSRRVGMADVASSVLHNVGNVLNSVNISAGVVATTLRQSSLGNVARTAALLAEHHQDIGTYLTHNPQGRLIPEYLSKLGEQLSFEQTMLLEEIEHLQGNVEHIKQIILAQQSLARSGGIIEQTNIVEVIEQALALASSPRDLEWIKIVRTFEELPSVLLDKHQVLQVLTNLIRNAIEAMKDSDGTSHVLTIGLTSVETNASLVRITVSDTGIGIAPENLPRMFHQGFTTKKDGHGFGLHSAALSAKAMYGSLSVHSDGARKGATFTLDLPYRVKAVLA